MIVIHAADLHVDSPLVGLQAYPGCPADTMRDATRRAFDALIALCLRERAALLLLAGDVFDGDWRDYNSGLYLNAGLSRLREVGTRVAIVRGNHDAANEMTRTLRAPEGVHVFEATGAGTLRLDTLGVAVHGMSYPVRDVMEDLVPRYPAPLPGLLNLGLLHTNVGARAGHAAYAPTTTGALAAKGYDYWALGHVHEHAILATEPWIVYPGNTQGRSVRELGPRGCVRLEVDEAAGRIRSVHREILDVARWAHARVGLQAEDGLDELYAKVGAALAAEARAAEGRTLAVRVEVAGPTRAERRIAERPEEVKQEIRSLAMGLGADVWVEKVVLRTHAAGVAPGGIAREVARVVAGAEQDPAALRALATGVEEDLEQLLPLVRRQAHEPEGLDVPDPRDEEVLRRALERAGAMVAARLGGAA